MGHKGEILVIEDDQAIREGLKELLELEGFGVTLAENGKIALNIMAKLEKCCLIILDWLMPIMGGGEFLEQLTTRKDLKDYKDVPLIVLSGDRISQIEFTSHKRCRRLEKPVDLDHLLHTVREHCGG
jgi:CheY-like chemotaxis protein